MLPVKEAIEKLDSDQYDIALVDIQLSNGNGFSVCSAIKERGTMPVIFLTASDDEYSVVAGLDMGLTIISANRSDQENCFQGSTAY